MLDDKVQAFGKEAPSRQTRRFCGPNGGVEVCLWLFAGHRSQQFAPQNGPAQKERIIFQSHQFSGVSWRLALNFLGSNRSKPDKSQHLRYNQEFASAYKLVFHPQRFRGYIDFSGSTACDDFYFFSSIKVEAEHDVLKCGSMGGWKCRRFEDSLFWRMFQLWHFKYGPNDCCEGTDKIM